MQDYRASRHPNSRVNRSPLVQRKQYIVPITTPRERHLKCDVKPPVSVHAHSRPSSAKIRSLVEKCDILQQNLENDKKLIVHINVDVVQTKEEYKRLCVEFGKKEDWHRIVDLSVMVDNIQRQFTELERKLVHYNAETSKLKETNNKLKWRLKQLDGRCVVIADKKQKLIKEQLSTPSKNLKKRAKVQGVIISPSSQPRTADLQLNRSAESVKAGKSDIQVLFIQNQSELDNLITTERRLKENINGLQASHNTINHDILKLKEKKRTGRSGRKHKQEVQKTATKQVHQKYQVHTLQPSQSTNQLEAMANEIVGLQNQLNDANEKFREQLMQTEQQVEAKWIDHIKEKDKRIVGLQNQLNDANEKFREQLMQTEQQVEAKWIDHIKEKDKRIAELEKSISDMKSEAINHQRLLQQYEHQIKELKLKSERISKDSASKLNKVNENYRSIVAHKDSKLKACQQSLKKLSLELTKAKGDMKLLQTAVSAKHIELENCHINLNKKSTELLTAKEEYKSKEADLIHQIEGLKHEVEELKNACKKSERISKDSASKLNKVNENYRSIVAKKDSELKACQQRIAELEKSISDMKSEAINHQRLLQQYEHQIKELKLKHKQELQKTAAKQVYQVHTSQSTNQLKAMTNEVRVHQERELHRAYLETELQQQKDKLQQLSKEKESLEEKIVGLQNQLNDANEKFREQLMQTEQQVEAKWIDHIKEKDKSIKESSLELTKAKGDMKLLQTAVSTKHIDLENCRINLNEKSTELVTANEQFKLKEVDLLRQIEGLKHEVEELKNTCKKLEKAFHEKDSELAKTKERYQTAMAQKNEGLPRRREKSTSPVSKQDDQSHETIPKKVLIEKLKETEQELKKYQESLLKYEEKSFKYTNAFTSAGEGSVLDMSKRYRHLQHNKRAAAARALKKAYKIEARDHICDQIMRAYETARSVVLDEATTCIKNNLFDLQTTDERNKELLQGCMMILSCIQEDEKIKNIAINKIKITLDQLYKELMNDKPLPSEVEDYYQSLAELAWCAVARPIPMIIAKSPDAYCKCYHELKDGEDVEDGSPVSYVYPVLYSSNEWPRQVAQEGRVVLKEH